MQEQGFTKKDWTLFRNKIADWQEAYMDRLNKGVYRLTEWRRCSIRKVLEFGKKNKERQEEKRRSTTNEPVESNL